MGNFKKYNFSRVIGKPLELVDRALIGLVSFLKCSNSFIGLNGLGIDTHGCENETILNSRLIENKYPNKNKTELDIRIIAKKKDSNSHIGSSLGLTWLDAFCQYLTNSGNKEIILQLNELVDKIKYDEKVDTSKYIQYNNDILKVQTDLDKLLEVIPVVHNASLEDFRIIEDSRDEFINGLNVSTLESMINIFKDYGVDLSDLKNPILNILNSSKDSISHFNCFDTKKEGEIHVYTPFYKALVKNDLMRVYLNKSPLYPLFNIVTLGYMRKVLSEQHPLVFTESHYDEILWDNYDTFEAEKYYPEIRQFLDTVISLLDKNEITDNDNVTENSLLNVKENSLDAVLNEDKGKFKLTLFKTLAKENNLSPDMSRTEQDPSNSNYIVYFNNDLLHSVKPSIYYNPTEDNHCISIYMGETGDITYEYKWDKELDYNDFIKYLCKLVAEEEKRAYEKFKLTEFKQTCKRIGLVMNMSETASIKDKYYNILTIPNEKQYIIRFVVPIVFKTSKKDTKKLLIKTRKEEVYYTWEGPLNYDNLYEKIVKIHQEGLQILNQEYNDMVKQREKLEKERNELLETQKKVLKEYENEKLKRNSKLIEDSETMSTGKDVRAIFTSYILDNNKEIKLPLDFIAISAVLSQKLNDLGYPLTITMGSVSSVKGRGKSKVWALTNKDSILLVNDRSEPKKQIEGLLEGFVTRFTAGGTDSKTRRIRDGLTFMLCKSMGLDVRTYCEGTEFDSLYRADKKTKVDFVKETIKFYNDISQLFR